MTATTKGSVIAELDDSMIETAEPQTREKILEKLKRFILGPVYGQNEVIPLSPFDLYTTGIVYPQVRELISDLTDVNSDVSEGPEIELPDDFDEQPVEAGQDKPHTDESSQVEPDDDELSLTTQFRPSSIGVSGIVSSPVSIKGRLEFGTYQTYRKGEKTKDYFDERMPEFFLERSGFTRSNHSTEYIITISEDRKLRVELSHRNDARFSADGNSILFTDKISERQFKLCFFLRVYDKSGDKFIITASLVNDSLVDNFHRQKDVIKSIFQPVISLRGPFLPFDNQADLDKLEDEEELNIILLYRKYKRYALGHGVATDWNSDTDAIEISSSFIPQQHVSGMDFEPKEYKGAEVLFMKKLSGEGYSSDSLAKEALFKGLDAFVAGYRAWIHEEKYPELEANDNIHPKLYQQAERNLKVCEKLLARMEKGVSTLRACPDALQAFFDANKAMFMQRIMGIFAKERSRQNILAGEKDVELPDFANIDYDSDKYPAKWRPFQLAFLLSQIEGAIDGESEDRETVDLIWFPTGGGKTEAYLGLTAFTIFYRRLTAKDNNGQFNPDAGAGVTVLMRYTLRLLNKQQFNRATILILACELIRREEKQNRYGKIRISIGIWVGSSLTPNNKGDNTASLNTYIQNIEYGGNGEVKYPPIYQNCPCCGTKLVKERHGTGVRAVKKGQFGYFRRVRAKAQDPYMIACTNSKCSFHTNAENLNEEYTFPAYYTDDEIYEEQPTLVFATVDKFAQIAWKKETLKLFNLRLDNNRLVNNFPSPNLIIQDELHLISSALGTIYGVFEMAIDRYASKSGARPKIVAATATVRNAEVQCRRLYARKSFMQFPPPALDADDSFFAKKMKKDENARLYVGYMPSGVTTSTANIRLTSALLELTQSLEVPNAELQKYYTLLVYFNAKKELGKYRTFLEDDIVAYRRLISNYMGNVFLRYSEARVGELSSDMTPEDITMRLDRLENEKLPVPSADISLESAENLKILNTYGLRNKIDLQLAFISLKSKLFRDLKLEEPFTREGLVAHASPILPSGDTNDRVSGIDPFRIVPATNMVSVGVDIDMLNIMVINGQPKSASEYIQASSRVGRKYPGLVIDFLAPTKNRDRSHYEDFKFFHESYYQFVEATSVTPFSKPALEKAFPSVLVSLLLNELWSSLNADTSGRFQFQDTHKKLALEIINDLKQRIKLIDPKAEEECLLLEKTTAEMCETLIELTKNKPKRFSSFADFHIYAKKPLRETITEIVDILFEKKGLPNTGKLLPKMSSMRNVEPSSDVVINF